MSWSTISWLKEETEETHYGEKKKEQEEEGGEGGDVEVDDEEGAIGPY